VGTAEAVDALASAHTAVVFFAHPDDVDFGAGGTMAALSAQGTRVVYVVMTDGDAGGFDDAARASIVETRHGEQRRAAEIAGVSDVLFLGQRDGFLEPSAELVGRVVEILRQFRPDVVFSMHPERNWMTIQKSHPDHLACGEIVTRAVYPAVENNYAYPELRARGLEAYKIPWVFFMAGPDDRSNHWVDVTRTLETKLSALDVHMSQHPDPDAMHAHVAGRLAEEAARVEWDGEPAQYAEEFHAVRINGAETIAGF
jgi:LmbE family N-acetylglucosaminyl deacetylase